MEPVKIEQRLKELKHELKARYHVEKIGIFGSMARGDTFEQYIAGVSLEEFLENKMLTYNKALYCKVLAPCLQK